MPACGTTHAYSYEAAVLAGGKTQRSRCLSETREKRNTFPFATPGKAHEKQLNKGKRVVGLMKKKGQKTGQKKKSHVPGGIRTHAPCEIGALIQRLRPTRPRKLRRVTFP